MVSQSLPPHLAAALSSESDQIAAVLRDLTTGQRLALIRANLAAIKDVARELAKEGHIDRAATLALLVGLAGHALDDLINMTGEFQNADHVHDAVMDAARRLQSAAEKATAEEVEDE